MDAKIVRGVLKSIYDDLKLHLQGIFPLEIAWNEKPDDNNYAAFILNQGDKQNIILFHFSGILFQVFEQQEMIIEISIPYLDIKDLDFDFQQNEDSLLYNLIIKTNDLEAASFYIAYNGSLEIIAAGLEEIQEVIRIENKKIKKAHPYGKRS